MSRAGCNLFRHIALEEFYCDHKINWRRLWTHLFVVFVYQAVRAIYQGNESSNINTQSTSAYIFLCAASIWASNMDLLPACLNIWPSLEMLYDILSVTVIANLLLNYVWSEVITFIEIMSYHIYVYSENSNFGDLVRFIFDKDSGFICLSDAIAFVILIWVLCGIGIIDEIWETIKCAMTEEDNGSQCAIRR